MDSSTADNPDPDSPIAVTGEPVAVTPELVDAFATAVGASTADGGGVPATLAAAVTANVQQAILTHRRLRIDLSRTLHTAQASQHLRPIVVGDQLTATATVTGIRSARGGRMISFDTVLVDASGTPVHTLSSTLLTGEEQ